ncbi:isocitrate lyase/PEP mutase family protein [Pseudonocardia sp. TRM90224]|uniref:isocitrate lyase/PEP mutase family protein n=1 Tax=Pseudonocardia sp. TRM90224 TaxID=2812678 RepID=UPI001E5E57F7|nr:isocitrate lyase/phosphoenolpyruvate mutase family protein [Pseudonocardia sp. TRM90224]
MSFLDLHTAGNAFVMPNAWDAGSAVLLAAAGFPAIATTSAGIAFALGKADHAEGRDRVTRDEMFEAVRRIAAAVDLPVNGDLEDGYGSTPDEVAETIRMSIEIGLAGGNIEDYVDGTLVDEEEVADRIAAAREVIDASGVPFVLTGRTDGMLVTPQRPLAELIRRANRYRKAGADCLFVPAPPDINMIRTLAAEIDGPLNINMSWGSDGPSVAEMHAAGVARVSLGGTFARSVYGFLRQSARELYEHGTTSFADVQIPHPELVELFTSRRRG